MVVQQSSSYSYRDIILVARTEVSTMAYCVHVSCPRLSAVGQDMVQIKVSVFRLREQEKK